MQNEAQRKMDGKYNEAVKHNKEYSEIVFHMFNWLPRRRDAVFRHIQAFFKTDLRYQLQNQEAW